MATIIYGKNVIIKVAAAAAATIILTGVSRITALIPILRLTLTVAMATLLKENMTLLMVVPALAVIPLRSGEQCRLATMAAPIMLAMPRQSAALNGNHAAAWLIPMALATAACIALLLTAEPVW